MHYHKRRIVVGSMEDFHPVYHALYRRDAERVHAEVKETPGRPPVMYISKEAYASLRKQLTDNHTERVDTLRMLRVEVVPWLPYTRIETSRQRRRRQWHQAQREKASRAQLDKWVAQAGSVIGAMKPRPVAPSDAVGTLH